MRIVGGRLRGRALAAPKSQAVRPTADRLREALFNILVHAYGDPVTGARVLDLFAGTGALGLEALSRGAAFALFVDDGAEARALIRENVAALGLGGVTRIFRRDATQLGAAHPVEPFSLAVPRSALWAGPGREGARLGARRRVARARRADRGGGGGEAGLHGARRIRGARAARLRRHRISSCCSTVRDARSSQRGSARVLAAI